MKEFLLICAISIISFFSVGQNSPVPYRQFYFNPYLFNPAYAAINGYNEVYASYRKQWLNVNDAPVISGFNFQYATRKRVSLGINIISQDVVALRNTSAMATFVYSLPLATDQSLRFGISGGVGLNKLHLEEGEYDPTDETIQNAIDNSIYADGNFGAVYANNGLRIGFALPTIFGQKNISQQELGTSKFSQLKNQIYSASYKFDIKAGSLSIEPYFIYRSARDNQNSWEAAAVLYLKEAISLGASYHQTNGVAFLLGVNVKDKFRFGYSYELPPVDNDFISTNSHEIHLNFRIGKKKESLAKKEKTKTTEKFVKTDSVKNEELIVTKDQPIEAAEENTVSPAIVEQNQEPVVTQEEPIVDKKTIVVPEDATQDAIKPTVKKSTPPRSFALAKGHYVTLGVFRVMENASHYLMELDRKGIEGATVAINPENNYYYVYIFSTYDIDEARKIRNQYRVKRPFSEAWIFTMK